MNKDTWKEVEIVRVDMLELGNLKSGIVEMKASDGRMIGISLEPHQSEAVDNFFKKKKDETIFGLLKKILDLSNINPEFILLRKEDCKIRLKGQKSFDIDVSPSNGIVLALQKSLKIFITEEFFSELLAKKGCSIKNGLEKVIEEMMEKAAEEEDFEKAAWLKKQLYNLRMAK